MSQIKLTNHENGLKTWSQEITNHSNGSDLKTLPQLTGLKNTILTKCSKMSNEIDVLENLDPIDSTLVQQYNDVMTALSTIVAEIDGFTASITTKSPVCLLYTSPSPRDKRQSRMPSSA